MLRYNSTTALYNKLVLLREFLNHGNSGLPGGTDGAANMRLGVSYNVFDGEELLYKSILSIGRLYLFLNDISLLKTTS